MRSDFKSVEQYIKSFPKETQEVLEEVRKIIKDLIPNAEEVVSYQIPTFKLNGKYVIYFAGFKNHFSLYPVSQDIESSIKGLAPFIYGKGTAKFPLDKPIPTTLIKQIVKYKLKLLASVA